MAHRIADRIKETASTSGTVSFTLAGAVSGFVTFASALTTNGDTTWYCAVNGAEWEVGLGTRTSSTVLARTTILASSNAGAAVNFTVAPTVFSTLPASAMAPLAGPAFSAYRSADQTITAATLTKVALNAEEYDTDSAFDSTTNSRFTPTVAGYYHLSWCARIAPTSGTTSDAASLIYKNGAALRTVEFVGPAFSAVNIPGSCDVYLNGTTDYVELWAYAVGTTPKVISSANQTFMSGHLVRAG